MKFNIVVVFYYYVLWVKSIFRNSTGVAATKGWLEAIRGQWPGVLAGCGQAPDP